MAYSRFSRAAHLKALKKDLARKRRRLAAAVKASEPNTRLRSDLAAPKMKYWRDQIKLLETAIKKAEGSRKAQKAESK